MVVWKMIGSGVAVVSKILGKMTHCYYTADGSAGWLLELDLSPSVALYVTGRLNWLFLSSSVVYSIILSMPSSAF